MERMYFVAVLLPAALDEKILRYKKQMQEAFGCKVGLKSPAHVTLVPPFWMHPDREPQLKSELESIACGRTPFPVQTANFSAFKPRTLFVAVRDNEKLYQLKQDVDRFFHTADYKTKPENRPFHPHITIATRDLHKAAFAEAWPRFQNEIFAEEFSAGGLSLLKHDGRAWDVIFTAAFKD